MFLLTNYRLLVAIGCIKNKELYSKKQLFKKENVYYDYTMAGEISQDLF